MVEKSLINSPFKGGKIEFDEQKFIESRPPTMQPFLEQMLQLQIFRQFCEERLAMLNDRRGISDEFEMEVVRFQVSMFNVLVAVAYLLVLIKVDEICSCFHSRRGRT